MKTIDLDTEGLALLKSAGKAPGFGALVLHTGGRAGFVGRGRDVARGCRRRIADRVRAQTQHFRDRGLYGRAYRTTIIEALPELGAVFPQVAGLTAEAIAALCYLDEKGAY